MALPAQIETPIFLNLLESYWPGTTDSEDMGDGNIGNGTSDDVSPKEKELYRYIGRTGRCTSIFRLVMHAGRICEGVLTVFALLFVR